MNVRFYVDPDTGLTHVEQHGVSGAEVVAILSRPIENRPGDRDSRIVIGRGNGGRFLRVIVVFDDDGEGVFVVTAYPLAGKALRALRRRMKHRGEK